MSYPADTKTIDESADDVFCENLYRQYLAYPDKGGEMSFEEAARQLGVDKFFFSQSI